MPPNLEPPRYSRRDLASSWYHALYGQVPGSEQDPMFEPEVDDDLDARHLSNLAQIMTALAPTHEGGIGLTFANLSKGLHDHHPGSGGLALIASFRALRRSGSVDHAGREGPLIKHALISANRALDRNTLHLAALSLLAHTVGIQNAQNTLLVNRSEGPVDAWYREYRQLGALPGGSGLQDRKQCILKYAKDFDTLPELYSVVPSYRYSCRQPPHRLLYIEYPDTTTYYDLAGYSAQLAAALYMAQMTDSPWAVIEIGTRGYDIYDGIAIRFVPRGYLRPNDPGHRVDLDELPPLGTRDGREQLNRFLAEQFNATFEVVSLSVPSCPLPGGAGDGLQTPRLPPLSGGDSTVMVPAAGAATVLGDGPSTFREHRGPVPQTIVQPSDGAGKPSEEQTRYHILAPRESFPPVQDEIPIETSRGHSQGGPFRFPPLWGAGSAQPLLYGLYGLGALAAIGGLSLVGVGLWGRPPAPALKDFQPLVEKVDETRNLLQGLRDQVRVLRDHAERPCPPRGGGAEPSPRSDRTAVTAPQSPENPPTSPGKEKGIAGRRGVLPKGNGAPTDSPYQTGRDVQIVDDSSKNGQRP